MWGVLHGGDVVGLRADQRGSDNGSGDEERAHFGDGIRGSKRVEGKTAEE